MGGWGASEVGSKGLERLGVLGVNAEVAKKQAGVGERLTVVRCQIVHDGAMAMGGG